MSMKTIGLVALVAMLGIVGIVTANDGIDMDPASEFASAIVDMGWPGAGTIGVDSGEGGFGTIIGISMTATTSSIKVTGPGIGGLIVANGSSKVATIPEDAPGVFEIAANLTSGTKLRLTQVGGIGTYATCVVA